MNALRKFTAGLLSLAILAMPFQASAVENVRIESTVQVANVTAGDTQYADSVNAKVDEVVKVQVWYHNKENPDSGKIAQNLKVKIALPTNPGKSQVVTSTVSADNSNTVVDTANVNLSLDQARLEYIPGSAKWRHNKGTNEQPNWVTENIDDSVVGAGGKVLENEKPCFNFEATVTVLARVKANSVSIVKQVRKAGETAWTTSNVANPGDTLEYMITVKNTGNTTLKHVIVGDNLPPHMTYVNGSTKLKNMLNPNGVAIKSDNVTKGGIDIGDYAPGSVAYVLFQVKVDSNLNPGCTDFKNVGVVRPEGMNEFYNVALTKVCKDTPVTPPVTPPTTLPETGAELPVAGLAGMGGMSYAVSSYLKSKKGVKAALRDVRK